MKTPQSPLPDLPTLTQRLTAGLEVAATERRPVRVLERSLPRFMDTFPNEIVTCQLANGRVRRVFVKYGGGQSHISFGHRGDVPYEAEVYRRVVAPPPPLRPPRPGAPTEPA